MEEYAAGNPTCCCTRVKSLQSLFFVWPYSHPFHPCSKPGPGGLRGMLLQWGFLVEASWNVMAHAQKPDFVFPLNGRVHLNRRGRQFSRLLAAEVCASAFIVSSNAGYIIFWGSVKGTGHPLHSPVSPSLPHPLRHRVPSHFNWSLPNLFSWEQPTSVFLLTVMVECYYEYEPEWSKGKSALAEILYFSNLTTNVNKCRQRSVDSTIKMAPTSLAVSVGAI